MKQENIADKFMSNWEKIPGLLRLVVVYALLNGIIYAGQELYYYPSTHKMKQLDSEMSNIQKDITRLELYATDGGLGEPWYSQYKNSIDEYNKKTGEYNELSKKSGNRWWLIPIPIPRGGGKTVIK